MKIAPIFHRFPENPLLSPTQNSWENLAVFNPGVIQYGKKIILLYRAIGHEKISVLGLAKSNDGINFQRLSKPFLTPAPDNNDENLGLEDPRITYVNGRYYIIYVGASTYPDYYPHPPWAPDRPWRIRISARSTTDFKKFTHHGVILPHIDSKDATLFPEKIDGQYLLLHREFPNIGLAQGHFKRWKKNTVILKPRPGMWDGNRIGAGAPPVKTKEGWLLIYHGVDDQFYYRQGVVLLDLKDPFRVIARCREPFFEPSKPYELGIANRIARTVFCDGYIQDANTLKLYYGAADKYVCGGTVAVNDLLDTLEPVKSES